MKKNFKIITINGFRGIAVAIFVVLGLIAGFIISPGWVCMKAWNYFLTDTSMFVQMNLLHGIMLWGIIALVLYALNGKKTLIGFGAYPKLSPEQIKDIMEKAKSDESKIFKDLEEKIKETTKNFEKELISQEIENKEILSNEKEKEEDENSNLEEKVGR